MTEKKRNCYFPPKIYFAFTVNGGFINNLMIFFATQELCLIFKKNYVGIF